MIHAECYDRRFLDSSRCLIAYPQQKPSFEAATLTKQACEQHTMKFAKILKRKAEEWQTSGLGEHFLRYKALKQQLKQISGAKEQTGEAMAIDSILPDPLRTGGAKLCACWVRRGQGDRARVPAHRGCKYDPADNAYSEPGTPASGFVKCHPGV